MRQGFNWLFCLLLLSAPALAEEAPAPDPDQEIALPQEDGPGLYARGLDLLKGPQRDYKQAARCFNRAASLGHIQAYTQLGLICADGLGVPQNLQEAYRWYCLGAQLGDAQAQYLLGQCYAEGLGVEQDWPQARYFYEKAAAQNQTPAWTALGQIYAEGHDVRRDPREAFSLTKRAAEAGDAQAQYNLGLMYQDGAGVRRDRASAAAWFEKAALGGLTDAMNDLGVMYEKGDGLKADSAAALKWYRMAADADDAAGQYNLAALLDKTGQGSSQQILDLFRSAADQGFAPAQLSLGARYVLGTGVEADLVQAYAWFSLADAGGDVRAKACLEHLRENLSPEDRVLAVRLFKQRQALMN